ncbi:unnamed protein product [Didymodactylos carnosus]|uniref:Uncharacterized protein n=1 Tax=Didymodactylos carnosus TaxID=1234261 RepID=A0A813QL44_9BILA|nr:unnamed protein product [Didymodactylos carnosus]CAF0906777.1 unnamed protein product [Didymodactylos carnosus]CAF3551020.1 unnamed protein product [Didymodactylos carnosus]CAF3686537.1 unnamed protein product [Didymodactylos carnosus]
MKIDMILPGVVCWIFLMLTVVHSFAFEHQIGKDVNADDEQKIHILEQHPSTLLSLLEDSHPTKFYPVYQESDINDFDDENDSSDDEHELEKRRFNAWAGKRMVPTKQRFNAWAGKRSIPFYLREGRRFNAWAGK